MARRVERGQQASARTLPSDHSTPDSQSPQPGTSFSIPQPNNDTVRQRGQHLQGSQPPRPGTPFSIPQPDYNTLPQRGQHLTRRDPKDFTPPGLIRQTRHKSRFPKPYEEQRFKKPDAHVTERLQELKALIKTSARKRTLDPLRELRENKKWTVPLPLKGPEGMSNPMNRDTRTSALQPAKRKRVASSFVPIPEKVKKSRAMSTGFEEPMDFDQLGAEVPATSTKHSPGDTSEKSKDDHNVLGLPSVDQRGQVSDLSNSPPMCVAQDSSGQGDLQQSPSDKNGTKPSHKGKLSDLTLSTNGPTTSPQESLTHLTTVKEGQRVTSSHKDSQRCPPSLPKCPMQSASRKVSLRLDPADHEDIRTSVLNQEPFQSTTPLKHGLRSSLTVQRGQNPTTIPPVSLTPIIPAQAETKLSTSTPAAQGPLPFSEGALESSQSTHDVVQIPESSQGSIVPSSHTHCDLAPSSSSPGILRPFQSLRGALGMCISIDEGQRSLLKSTLSQKRRIKQSPAMRSDPKHSHSRRVKYGPSKQRVFTMSLSDRELFKYPLPAKRALLSCHQVPENQGCSKTLSVCHASSKYVQGADTIQPSLSSQWTLGHSVSTGEPLKISTYTSGMLGFPKPVQDFLSTTLSHKGTVGKDTSTKGVVATIPSLEMALGCNTSTKHVLGHIPSEQKVLDPILCERGEVGHDMNTQLSVSSSTSKEEDSLVSNCAQQSIGPSQTLQEAMGTSLPPQGQPSSQNTQDAIDSYPSTQTAVGIPPCPQKSPEHLPNIPKALDSISSFIGALEPVFPIKLASKPDTSIQNVLSSCPASESFLGPSTSTQQRLETSLSAHEALRPLTYVHDALGEATTTQAALVHSPHSAVTVKTPTHTQGTLRPSPSEKDALGFNLSEQGRSPSTQEGFFPMPSLGGTIRCSPSTEVNHRHPVSRKDRLRVDPSDGDFRPFLSVEDSSNLPPSAKRGLASSPAAKETSKATTTPQVSPTPTFSVQKTLECTTNDSGTVESWQSTQRPAEHSIYSQQAQGPSLSTQKTLVCSPSVKGLQGISSSFSVAPEHVPHAQSDLSFSKLDFRAIQPSLNFQESEGKYTSKKNCLEIMPLAQAYLKTSMSPKAYKNPPASSILAGEYLPSALESPRPSKSNKGYLETLPAVQSSSGCSAAFSGALCAQRTIEALPSAQGVQKAFPSSVGYSEHLPQVPRDQVPSTLAQEVLGHAAPGQGLLETSSSSPRITEPLISLQRPLDISTTTQSTAATSSTTQGALAALLSLLCKEGTCQSGQQMLGPLPPRSEALSVSPLTAEAPRPLPVAPETLGLSPASPETKSYLSHIHGVLDLSHIGPGSPINVIPPTQWQQGTLLSSEGSVAPSSSVQGTIGQSLPAQETLEHSTYTQGTVRCSLSGPGDMATSLSSQGTKGPLPSGEVGMGTHLHAHGSSGHLTNVSGFTRHMLSDQDPVGISLPGQESLTHLLSSQGAKGLSLSAHSAPEVSNLDQGSIQPLKPVDMDIMYPSSSSGTVRQFECAQHAVEHLLPGVGALKHSVIDQRTQKNLTSVQETRETLPSLSKAIDSFPGTGALQPSLSAPRALEHKLSTREPEKLSTSAPGSLGLSLSTQEAPGCLAPLLGNLKPCQFDKESHRTLRHSQAALESSTSISGRPSIASLPSGHTGLSFLPNETQKHSQYAEGVVKSTSTTGTQASMTFSQKSLENYLSGQGIIHSLTSSQEGTDLVLLTPQPVEKTRPTKVRLKNVSYTRKPVKPLNALEELSVLIQGTLQHSKSATGTPGPSQPDSGIQGSLPCSEVACNSTSAPGAFQPGPFTLQVLDNLQPAEGHFKLSVPEERGVDSFPSTQEALQTLEFPSGVVEISKSEYRKHGHLSNVRRDINIFPSDTGVKGISPSASPSSLPTEALVSSSSCQGPQGSLLSTKEGVKHSLSAPDAQKPYPSTAQALEHLVTTQGPLQTYTPSKQNSLSSILGDFPLQRALAMSSLAQGTLEPLVYDHGEGTKYQSEKDNLVQPISVQETIGPSACKSGALGSTRHAHRKAGISPSNQGAEKYSLSPRGAMGLPKSETKTLKNLPSDQGSMKYFSSFQKASTSSLFMEDTLQQSPAVAGALRSISYTQGTKKSLLSSPESVKTSPLATYAQNHTQTTLGTLATVRCKQGPLEHSMPVQGTMGSSTPTSGFLEHSTSLQNELGCSSCNVESQNTLPTSQGSAGPLQSLSGLTGHSQSDQGSQEPSLEVTRDLAHLLSTKLCISAQATLGPSSDNQQSLQQSSSSQQILRTSESAQCTHEHLSSVSGSLGMSPCVPRSSGTLPHAQKPLDQPSTTQASPDSSPSLKISVTTSLHPQGTLELNASAQIFQLQAASTQVPRQLSLHANATMGQPITAQGIEELFLSCSGTLDWKESDKQEVEIFPSAQVSQGSSLPAEGTLRSSSSAQGVLGTSLSAQGSLKLSTSKENIGNVSSAPNSLKHPTPSQRGLQLSPSCQHTIPCSSCSQQTTGPLLSTQENQGTFFSSSGYTEHYPSAPGVQVLPLCTPAAVGPLITSQRHTQNFTAAIGTLSEQSSLPSLQRNQKCLSHSTRGLGQYAQAQSSLEHLPCVWEDVESSQSALRSIGSLISSHPGEYLDLSAPQGTESSSQSVQGDMGPCLSAKGTPKLTKSKNVSLGSSPSAQGTGGHSLFAQASAGQSMSAKQTVGSFPSRPGPLGSAQNIHMPPGSLLCDQMPLGLSLSTQGNLSSSSSSQVALGHSISDQGSLKLSTSKQGTEQPGTSSQKTFQLRTSCQSELRFTPYAQHAVQSSTSSPRSTGPFFPSQKSQESILDSPAYETHSTSVLGAHEHTLSNPESQEFRLTPQKPKELSRAVKGTLPVQRTLTSIQRNLDTSAYSTEILEQYNHTQSTLGHLPCVREDVASSQSASATLGMVPTLPPELSRHSFSIQTSAQTFPSGQGYLAPLQSSQGLLTPSISAQVKMNTSQHPEGSQYPLGLSSSEQGMQASSDSAHGPVGPCLSTQGAICPSASTQRSTQASTTAHRLSSPSLHTQGLGTQSTYAQCTVANSPSSPVCQEHTYPAQKIAGILKPDQGSLKISATAQGSVEPLLSPEVPLGYSSSAPGARNASTPNPGRVVSGDLHLEHSISAQLYPLLSSLSLLDPSLSVEGTFNLSQPSEVTREPPTSCQETLEYVNSAQRVQQADPSASDSSGSMNSFKGPMGLSLTGQGTLGSASSDLGPLAMSLPVQLCPASLLSVQEAGGPCLFLQGNLEGCTSIHGMPRIPNASPGDLKNLPSTTANLVSSPSVQLNLGESQPVIWSLKPPLSAQGVPGILTSAPGPPEISLLSQEASEPCMEKEYLGYSPSNPEDLGLSESSPVILEKLPCAQNTGDILYVTQEIIEPLSPAQNSLRFLPPSPHSSEAEAPLQSTQSIFKSSEPVPGTLESLPTVPGAVWHLKPNESVLGTLASEQEMLETLPSHQESLEVSQPAQGPLEHMPSTQDTMGTSFSTEFPELSFSAHGDFLPSDEECPRQSSCPKESLPSSKYARKDPSPTSTPQRSISSSRLSELSVSSSTPSKEDLRHSPSPGHCSRHSKSWKMRSRHVSLDNADLKSVPSEDEGWELCHSSKTGVRAHKSDKRDTKLKSRTNRNLTTSDTEKGASGSSLSHEEGLGSPPPSQGIRRRSKSNKTTSQKAPSYQMDTQASHSEQESYKPSSLSKRGPRHSSSSKKDIEQKATPQESIASSISREEGMQTTPSHEENLRHSTYPHGIHRHSTSTRRRWRNFPDIQGSLDTSPVGQEGNEKSPDEDSPHGGVKLSSSPQGDINLLVSTKEGSEHALIFQDREKPSISAKQEHTVLVPFQWGFAPPPVQKGSATSLPVSQGQFRHTLCQAEDVIPALYCEGRDPSLRYEFGYPLCDPSVLGGHRYVHHVRSNLKRIPLERGRCSSIPSPQGAIRLSQSDQCGLRLSTSHLRDIGYVPPVSGRPRMFQAERDGLSNATSSKRGLRDDFYDKRESRNVSTNPEWVRPSSSALRSLRLSSSAQGGTRASQLAKWNL